MGTSDKNSPPRPAGPKVFISYRRRFDHATARLLKDALTAALGEGTVFRDVDDIAPSELFPESILKAIESCDVFLPIISPGWLGIIGDLRDPEDFVRREIAAALARPAPVIPVLVGGARMPDAKELPEEISGLASRQAVELSDSRWDYDVRRLIEAIRARGAWAADGEGAGLTSFKTRPRRLAAAGLLAAVLLAAGFLYYRASVTTDGGKVRPTPEPTPSYAECLKRLGGAGTHEASVALQAGDAQTGTPVVWVDEYKRVSPPPPEGFPILVKLTDSGRDLGAVSLRFLRGGYPEGGVAFKVERVVEPPCAEVTDYFNKDGNAKAEVYNWNRLSVRLGGRGYRLRLGDHGDSLLAALTREAEQ